MFFGLWPPFETLQSCFRLVGTYNIIQCICILYIHICDVKLLIVTPWFRPRVQVVQVPSVEMRYFKTNLKISE